MCDAVTHKARATGSKTHSSFDSSLSQVLKDKLKQAEMDFKYPFAYQFQSAT